MIDKYCADLVFFPKKMLLIFLNYCAFPQVKVWFQNRRTKHKRVETEDEIMKKPDGSSRGHNNNSSSDLPSSGSNHSAISADSSTRNYSEEMSDEEIDMHDEYSDEEEMEHGHHHGMHHLSNSYS